MQNPRRWEGVALPNVKLKGICRAWVQKFYSRCLWCLAPTSQTTKLTMFVTEKLLTTVKAQSLFKMCQNVSKDVKIILRVTLAVANLQITSLSCNVHLLCIMGSSWSGWWRYHCTGLGPSCGFQGKCRHIGMSWWSLSANNRTTCGMISDLRRPSLEAARDTSTDQDSADPCGIFQLNRCFWGKRNWFDSTIESTPWLHSMSHRRRNFVPKTFLDPGNQSTQE
mgnify:CR=1 FL=1